MIKLIQSSRIKIPIVYLTETEEDIKELPIGIPFIRGHIKDYDKYVKTMEWEVLWKSMVESKFKLKWEKLLEDNGFECYNRFQIARSREEDGKDGATFILPDKSIGEFLKEVSYKVDIEVLRSLHLLPYWFDIIEDTINVNLANTVVYNPTLYTKKLGLPLGGFELPEMQKNVIIIDISGSIPKAISSNILIFAKTFAELFYADVLITGSISKLYDYNQLDSLDIETIYNECGLDNDQVYFEKIVSEPRTYKSAIVFGDNHNPSMKWNGKKDINQDEGKKICKWKIGELISLHTSSNSDIAGYARWFDIPTDRVQIIENWVKYLN